MHDTLWCLGAAGAGGMAVWWWAEHVRARLLAREHEAAARAAHRAETELTMARHGYERLVTESRVVEAAARTVDEALQRHGFNWWER